MGLLFGDGFIRVAGKSKNEQTVATCTTIPLCRNRSGPSVGLCRYHRELKRWEIKYFKGLGTSKDSDAKAYFSDLDTHKIKFSYEGQASDQVIDLACNPISRQLQNKAK